MNLTYFRPERRKCGKQKQQSKSTTDLLPKHQTSEISLKTSDLMLKHQKWQHC